MEEAKPSPWAGLTSLLWLGLRRIESANAIVHRLHFIAMGSLFVTIRLGCLLDGMRWALRAPTFMICTEKHILLVERLSAFLVVYIR